jgi:hypothetical protein
MASQAIEIAENGLRQTPARGRLRRRLDQANSYRATEGDRNTQKVARKRT